MVKGPQQGMGLSERLSKNATDLDAGWERDLTHWLARCGRANGLRVLGLMGILSSEVDECGLDALTWAARGGDEESLLLAGEICAGGHQDGWGGSALHHWAETKLGAAGAGAQILLAFGVSAVGRDQWGLLPMHWSRDPGVWSWSMAALWSRGEPNGWMSCEGVPYEQVVKVIGNYGLPEWIAKSKGGFRPTAAQRKPAPVIAQSVTWCSEKFLRQIAEREQMIGQMCERQNCIAQKLGIELLLSDVTE